MRIIINKKDCLGCRICERISPENFKVEDVCQVSHQPGDLNEEMHCQEAAEACPAEAIEITN